MVSERQQRARIAPKERARELAQRFPEAREALEFCATILAFHSDWIELRALVMEKGPPPLRELAETLTSNELRTAMDRYLCGEDRESPASFFARVLLRRNPPHSEAVHANRCPECGEPPQCASLYPEGHGSVFFLVCSQCPTEWRFPRAQCPICGESTVFYSSERMAHVQTQVCENCHRYLHVVDLGREPEALPLIDEVAALAIDAWAAERGLRKICPNLAGI